MKTMTELMEEYDRIERGLTPDQREHIRRVANACVGFPPDYPYDTIAEGAD